MGADGVAAARVCAPARLHLGFLDLNGGLARRFGGLGVGLKGLSTVAIARRSDRVRVTGGDEGVLRAATAALAYFGLDEGVEIEIQAAPPRHQGLGAGTQLALAAGAAIAALHGVEATVEDLALATGRGQRSGVGLGVFQRGGFILDGGRGAGRPLPTVVSRHDFPEAWRFVLAFAERGQGLSGAAEREAFKSLPAMPPTTAATLCRWALMQTLPALVEGDCRQFGASLSRIQACCGEYFAPAQGGDAYANGAVRRAVEFLLARQATGGGQSSWGPTGFALFPDENAAREAMGAFNQQAQAGENRVKLRLVGAENSPARIERMPEALTKTRTNESASPALGERC